VSNLLQSLLCGVCLLITPVLQQIPRSVLWGFFAFMALEGLPGNQFYKRLLLFFTDSTRLSVLTDDPDHDSYLDNVPMNVILKFTACQLAGLLICYGITWAGIVGISFPLFIMILVPAREYVLIKFFSKEHLAELDPLDLSDPDHANDWDVHHEGSPNTMMSARNNGAFPAPAVSAAPQPGFAPILYTMPPPGMQVPGMHMPAMQPMPGTQMMPMMWPTGTSQVHNGVANGYA